MTTSPSAQNALSQRRRSVVGIVSVIIGNVALVVASVTLMRGSGETTKQVLTVIAALSATAGLAWTIFYVHQPQLRWALLFLLAGVFCLLVGDRFQQLFTVRMIAGASIILVIISAMLSIRAVSAQPE